MKDNYIYNVLDLFSGIGGFSLGLEWTRRFKTVAFCENDLSCHKILNKHWKTIPIYSDIKELTFEKLKKDKISKIDIITGGFPCQDISQAGKKKGIKASRSGLWTEMCRLIDEIQPRYAIVENVGALLVRGMECVLEDLVKIGYDAEWHCIPASAIGAPHQRDRVWIIAYSNGSTMRDTGRSLIERGVARIMDNGKKELMAETRKVSNSKRKCRDVRKVEKSLQREASEKRIFDSIYSKRFASWGRIESRICRVADGIPNRMDRLRQLGNSVVPQIPYLIGMSIIEMENERRGK